MDRTLRKWDFEKRKYTKAENTYEVELILPLGSRTRCVNCGREMLIDDGYTSKQWHNRFGLGYPVCSGCYVKEWEEYRKYP